MGDPEWIFGLIQNPQPATMTGNLTLHLEDTPLTSNFPLFLEQELSSYRSL